MALPEDEESWEALDVMFATTRGTVRRNKLSDFAQVNRAGKIAMRIDEGERIVDVQICSDKDDVLLTTARGQCIRFSVGDVRVFKGRNSMGVRGIALAEGDSVISLAILKSFDVTPPNASPISSNVGRPRARRATTPATSRPKARMAVTEWRSALKPNGSKRCKRQSRSSLPYPRTATASGPHRSNIALPGAAAKASSPWRSTRATARLSPRSRWKQATNSCW